MMESWKKLRAQPDLLRAGWEKAGLGKVMQDEFQIEAMKRHLRGELKEEEKKRAESHHSVADEEDIEAEMEGREEEDVEDDEEEMNVVESLVAAVEDRPAVGVRRSAHIASSASLRQERAVLSLLQEEEIQNGITRLYRV